MGDEKSTGSDQLEMQRLKDALNESISGIIVIDLTRTITFVNKLWCQMHLFKPEELIGKNLSILYTKKEYPQKIEPLIAKAEKQQRATSEILSLKKDKKAFPMWFRIIASRDKQGNLIGFAGSGMDLTQQKQREKTLKKHMEELAKINETMVGRELQMIKLKQEINQYCKELGKKPKYKINPESKKK